MSKCVAALRGFCLAGCFLAILFAAPFLNAQNVIHVPADQPTIQAAINAAINGDTVLVAPGKYVENINFNGKAITLTSSGGPSVTTIDGGANGSVVTFNTGETNQSILSGFTILNGRSLYWAGGIQVSGASPTITGNVITGNYAIGGNGIYIDGGSPRITANTITGNKEIGSGGGGGGIYAAAGSGSPSSPVIIGNTISNNSMASGGNGGGIAVDYFSSPLIENNLIQGNTAYNSGGGISVQSYNSPIIVQNVIVGNSSLGGGSGGGLWVSPSSSSQMQSFVNNSIVGNTAADNTSGIYVTGIGQSASFTNNVIVAAGGQVAVTCDGTFSSISPFFSPHDAFSTSGQSRSSICNTTSQPGNLSADPKVLSASDAHLQWGSPAIDAGNNSAPSLPATDFDGNPRLIDGNGNGVAVVDLGAYEFFPTAISWAPNSLTFAAQTPGSSSAPQAVTVTNTGNQKLLVAISVDANFFETDNCGSSLAPGASCTVNVSFSPTVAGNITGNLALKDNASNSPQIVALAGTGDAPAASLSPASLNFGAQALGITSAPQIITLSNIGNEVMVIASIAPSGTNGIFASTNNCGSTLAPGASCSISVTFRPVGMGPASDQFSVTDNAPGSPQIVPLSGTGAVPVANLAPSSLTFGGQQIGTTSAAQSATLSNTGTVPFTISQITVVGDFAETNTCGTTLAAGANCSISVTFTPTVSGTRSGWVAVTDNASGGTQAVVLTGTGGAPVASLTPSSLSFGPQLVGTTSSAQTITLSNTGSDAMSIAGIASSGGEFVQTNNCGTTLAAGSSCSINVTFKPAATGSRPGLITVTDNAAGSPQSISLTGTGTAPAASLSPASLTFAGQLIGTTSSAQSATLSNTGSAPLTISAITISGDFAQTNNCGSTLAAGSSCSISVTFTPTAMGTRSGSITVTDNASGSPQSVSLTGTGTAAIASLSPASLVFGAQVIGTTSPAQTATVSNTGNAPLAISAISITGDFAETTTCGTTLAAGASCAINVTFTPSAAGARSGLLTVSSNSQNGTVSAALSGSGVERAPTFNPASLAFSSQIVGTQSGGKNVQLTANGPGPLAISSITVTGQFIESNNCPASLNSGSNCNITINFLPTVGGPATGSIVITDNGLGSPQTIPLSGAGIDFTLSASPSSVTVNAGNSAQYTVTATEAGGSFNNSVNMSCSGLPAGAKCQFSPGGISPKNGSATSALTIQTTAKQGSHGTPAGSYTITINGVSGSLKHTTTVSLTVN